MEQNNRINSLLKINYPVILAPMFLVSNETMLIAGMNYGVAASIPALNYRKPELLRLGLQNIRNQTSKGALGVNLIVNASNFLMSEQLRVCCEEKVDFIITYLGSPKEVIEMAKPLGIKVFCDVVDLKYALKVEELGADAVIAVNNLAGGHAGPSSPEVLIPELKKQLSIPVISAGGVARKEEMKSFEAFGADGFSIGTPFIASLEAGVSQEYKQACVDFGAKDIVMTTKLSGTPCTVINTDFVKEIGTKQSWLEKILNKNKRLKKWFKVLTFYRGMKSLEKAAFSATYKSVWCAGPGIEHVKEIKSVSKILDSIIHGK